MANTKKFGATSSLLSNCGSEDCQLGCGSSCNKCWHLISIPIIFQAALFDKSLTYMCLVIALSQAGNEAARRQSHAQTSKKKKGENQCLDQQVASLSAEFMALQKRVRSIG